MADKKKKPLKASKNLVLDASQIGEVEAMQLAAIRGLKLSDVGVEESLKNRIEFIKIKREVKKISEDGYGVQIEA